ncbi:hypothetical protein FJ414_01640 [Mesorhizobium sp. B3-1-6]|nr:hypothetical protein FJ414_01640 [Mesorhizobium sp. B3-1-6]
MTKTENKTASAAVKDILLSNAEGLREVIRAVMQEGLEAHATARAGRSATPTNCPTRSSG